MKQRSAICLPIMLHALCGHSMFALYTPTTGGMSRNGCLQGCRSSTHYSTRPTHVRRLRPRGIVCMICAMHACSAARRSSN